MGQLTPQCINEWMNRRYAIHTMHYVLRPALSLTLIALMIAVQSVWGQSEETTILEIQYSLDGEIADASPLLEDLQRKTTVQLGEPISRYRIRKSIEAIYASGYVSQVKAVAVPVQGGLRLEFQLTSKTQVGQIEFTGTHFDESLLLEVMKSRPKKEYSVEMVTEDKKSILDVYEDYGYFQATIHLTPSPNLASVRQVDLLYQIDEGDRARIREIRFEGVTSIKPKRLEKTLKSKKGGIYQKQSREEDMRRIRELYRKNGYLTVKVEHRLNYDAKSNTVSLHYKIIEGKKVTVKLIGDGIDREDLKKKLILFKRDNYSDTILKSTARQILRIHRQKGYYEPQVDYQIVKESNREVVIRFDIDLGKVLRIQRIQFEGNEAFPDDVLREQMEARPRSGFTIPGFGWLFSQGVFDPDIFETDRRALELFYKKAGFPDVQITTDKEIDPEDRLILYIKVDEGKQQLIHRVLIEGNTLLKTDQLYDKIDAEAGAAYSKDLVVDDVRYLKSRYDEKGYIYANIDPLYDAETGTLIYRISEGVQAKFSEFYFYGNVGIKLNVLKREFENLGLRKGAVFAPENLVKAQQRLFTLGLFRAIDIETPGRFEAKEAIDVDVLVEGRKLRSGGIGGGYSPSEGIRGTVEFTHKNLYKRNMRLGTKFRIGTLGNLYELTLIEPWLKLPLIQRFIGHTIGTFRLFEDNLEEQDDTRARGGTVNLAKRLGPFSNLALQYKYQELRQKRPELPEIHTTVSSLGISLHRDNRDHFLNPQEGWLNEISVEYAGGFLGGQTSFFKITTDHRYYRQLGGEVVLASAIRLGFEEGLRGNRAREI
ncbi:MAG: BamA/TamA family outer membrane protein, partial [Candidatus Poribacteria bacterium]|nr:BamA/TamA family outer membrane protein [Candidatus Poribacteria bacterium]